MFHDYHSVMSNAQLNSSQYPEPTDSSLMPGRIIPDGQAVFSDLDDSPSNLVPTTAWHYYQRHMWCLTA